MYPSGHENPGVAAVIYLLDDWLLAIEQGTVHLRQPDPNYVRPAGKPLWTEDELDTLICDIDYEVDQEVNRAPGTSVGARAGPGFKRLETPQRLALVQQLDALLKEHQGPLEELYPQPTKG